MTRLNGTEIHFDVSPSHHFESLRLPLRPVTEKEIDEARQKLKQLRAEFAEPSRKAGQVHRQIGRYETVVQLQTHSCAPSGRRDVRGP